MPIPELPGYSAVKQVWARYRESSFGTYSEFFVVIPALHNGEVSLYNPLIYVDRDSAMAGGREIGGWPKKMGDISMMRFGNEFKLSFSRNGQRLVSAEMQVGPKLFSTPLPANTPVSLSYPYNMTFPLPAPTAQPQPTVPMPTTTFKLIPGVGGDNPPPALAQLRISRPTSRSILSMSSIRIRARQGPAASASSVLQGSRPPSPTQYMMRWECAFAICRSHRRRF